MQAVKVEYTVQPEYVSQNKINIQKVMNYLKVNPIGGMNYSVFTSGEGNTFVHINMAKDGETMSKLNGVEAFTEFRMALKASNPISPPSQTKLNLVGATFEI